MSKIFYVDAAELAIDPVNPRRTKASADQDAVLLHSIQTHGLLQPLIVRPADEPKPKDRKVKWYVMDGGRRFTMALKAGLDELQCKQLKSEFGTLEIGTSLNMSSAPMHPLDVAEAIAKSLAKDEQPEGIANRFGKSVDWVRQRLALHQNLSPLAKKMFRDGEVSLYHAQQLVLGDHKTQDALLKRVAKGERWAMDNARRHMLGKKIPAAKALFDIALYPADKIERDLFALDDDRNEQWPQPQLHGQYLLDHDVFNELTEAHIKQVCAELEAEGWNVVRLAGDGYDKIGKYVKAEGRIKKEDRSKYAALVVYHSHSGRLDTDRGFVARSSVNAKKLRQKKGAGGVATGAVDAADVEANTAATLSDNQERILAALQTEALAKELDNGNVQLALYLICGAINRWGIHHVENVGRTPNFVGLNVLLDDNEKIEVQVAGWSQQTYDSFKDIDVPLPHKAMLCTSAKRLLDLPSRPQQLTTLNGGYVPPMWYRPTRGFLKRYRRDALQDYARSVGVDATGKNADIIGTLMKVDDHSNAVKRMFAGGVPLAEPANEPSEDDIEKLSAVRAAKKKPATVKRGVKK